MAESRSSIPPAASGGTAATKEQNTPSGSAASGFKSFAASFQEGLRYVKASVVGFTKKLTAKNEKEATEADLWTAKMQVEAADNAEDIKKRLS